MKNKTIYLDEDKIKCLMEAQESVVSPNKAKAEFVDGLLTVTIPFAKGSELKTLKIS